MPKQGMSGCQAWGRVSVGRPAGPQRPIGARSHSAARSPSGVAVTLGRRSATVALGPGHAAHSVVRVSRRAAASVSQFRGDRSRLCFPCESPARRLVGTARQADARATVSFATRPPWCRREPGLFHRRRRTVPGDANRAGRVHTTGRHRPTERSLQFPARRRAGTLTLPPGSGPFPAAVYVSGSGRTLRDEAQFLGGALVTAGIAVLRLRQARSRSGRVASFPASLLRRRRSRPTRTTRSPRRPSLPRNRRSTSVASVSTDSVRVAGSFRSPPRALRRSFRRH
jgi:hypothetical protein